MCRKKVYWVELLYNVFTRTVWQGTHHKCSLIKRILQGMGQGTSTLHLEQELDRKHLLERRHKLQAFSAAGCLLSPLLDAITEVDEMYQNAGEKGVKHPEPNDPPRQRGNKKRGHGTWDTYRPPILGIKSGQGQLEVKHNSTRCDLEPSLINWVLRQYR